MFIYNTNSHSVLVLFLPQTFTVHVLNKCGVRSIREGAVKSAASPDIHSRCWLDLLEPGPTVPGAGFSCLFLQVWCLMLIPPTCYPNTQGMVTALPLQPSHPRSSSQPVVFSLPVIRIAAMEACSAPTWKLPFFALLHDAFSSRPPPPPRFEPVWRRVMFTLPGADQLLL